MSVFYGEPKKVEDGVYAVMLRADAISLGTALQEVKSLAGQLDAVILFEFNGVKFKVAKDSNYFLLRRDWQRAWVGAFGDNPVVGPYPEPILSLEEITSYLRQKKEAAVHKVLQERESEAEQQLKQEAAELVLLHAPAMQVVDEDLWAELKQQAQGHELQLKQLQAAEQLARLIQLEMSNGIELGQSVEALYFQYGLNCWGSIQHYADILEKVWQYGVDLANWAKSHHILSGLTAAK